MNIRGYDAWKLRTPEEDHEASGGKLCPFCGAYSTSSCEIEDETDGICPWEESELDVDPDYLRDLKGDR